MLPYTYEENAWLSESRRPGAPIARPVLTSHEIALAVRRGRQLRAEAMARLPGQVARGVRRLARRLAQRRLPGLTRRPDGSTVGGQGFAHR